MLKPLFVSGLAAWSGFSTWVMILVCFYSAQVPSGNTLLTSKSSSQTPLLWWGRISPWNASLWGSKWEIVVYLCLKCALFGLKGFVTIWYQPESLIWCFGGFLLSAAHDIMRKGLLSLLLLWHYISSFKWCSISVHAVVHTYWTEI